VNWPRVIDVVMVVCIVVFAYGVMSSLWSYQTTMEVTPTSLGQIFGLFLAAFSTTPVWYWVVGAVGTSIFLMKMGVSV
jgi:hypothetical protein